jgi:general secretion pathway protein G
MLVVVIVIGGGEVGVQCAFAQSPAATQPARAPAANANGDRQAIQGTWYQVNPLAATSREARAEPERPVRLVITATEFQFPDQNAAQRTTYTLDPNTKHIDLVAAGQAAAGLYELNGEMLKIALPFRDGRDRPKELKDSPQVRVMILSRKPSAQAPAVARPDARTIAARSDLTGLETALDAYEIDTGQYPTTAEGLKALVTSPFNGRLGAGNWHGPYVRAVPNDPWGRPYRYRYPGAIQPLVLQLWSTGPDGQDGTADDITNWEQQ